MIQFEVVPNNSLAGKVHLWTRVSSTFRDTESTTDTSTPETRPCNVSSCMREEETQQKKLGLI